MSDRYELVDRVVDEMDAPDLRGLFENVAEWIPRRLLALDDEVDDFLVMYIKAAAVSLKPAYDLKGLQ